MSLPKVSVVIPTYNAGPFICETIESVLAQTYSPLEVIVVDDGSTDDTQVRLRPLIDRIRYIHKENGGVSTARNRGIREATGELIAFLDSDDVWHPRKLEIQVQCLLDNTEIGFLGTGTIDWPSGSFPPAPAGPSFELVGVDFEDLAVTNLFATSTILIRKSVVEKIGEFDTTLRGPEDYDYWLRCIHTTRGYNLKLPLTGYRTVQGSLGKQAVSMEAGMRRILEKLDETDAWQGRRGLRRKAYGYMLFSCAYMYTASGRNGRCILRLLASFAVYPWSFRRHKGYRPLPRVRLMGITLLRILGLKSPAAARIAPVTGS